VPRTLVERKIIEARRRKGVLVPILEEILENMVEVEDELDEKFMLDLMRARRAPREKGVFSPSMLGSCMRKAYFAKTGKQKFPATSPTTNYYFFDGDFRHYKWQFALWKAHRAGLLDASWRRGTGLPSERRFRRNHRCHCQYRRQGLHRGLQGDASHCVPDLRAWGTPDDYKIQIIGYGQIVNLACAFESFMGEFLGIEVEFCLLIGESKGGPSQRGSSVIALHEDKLAVKEHRAKVKRKMHTLRRYVTNEEVPPPACTNTRIKLFQECPFAPHCREEVKLIQKRLEADKKEKAEPAVRRSSRGKNSRPRKTALSGQGKK
jgi:hypothetical protein